MEVNTIMSCHTESNSHSGDSLRTHVTLNLTVTRETHLEHNVYSLHYHAMDVSAVRNSRVEVIHIVDSGMYVYSMEKHL